MSESDEHWLKFPRAVIPPWTPPVEELKAKQAACPLRASHGQRKCVCEDGYSNEIIEEARTGVNVHRMNGGTFPC
jgi:hypothetical protein